MAFRESLLGCIKKSVVDANLLNGVVMVEFTEWKIVCSNASEGEITYTKNAV